MVEVMVVAVVVGVASSVGVTLAVRTTARLVTARLSLGTLDFIQRERNAHVNRGVESDALVICATTGAGPCTGGITGDTLVAYRMPYPVTLPPTRGIELDRTSFDRADYELDRPLMVDAFARATTSTGAATTTQLTLLAPSGNETITFQDSGVVVTSFEAPSAIVVAPHANDIGQRGTSNPTPQAQPVSQFRGRRVLLE